MTKTDDRELRWLRKHREVCRRMTAAVDDGQVLAHILDAAIELTDAERGFLVLCGLNAETGRVRLKVEEARGFDKARILSGSGKVSRTVIMRVLDEDRPVLTTSELDADIPDITSVKDRRVRSIVAVPIRLRGETQGVAYLDHRFDPRAFTREDLPVLEAFADHAAVALESAALVQARSEASQRLHHVKQELVELRTTRAERARLGERPLTTTRVPRFGALVGDSAPMLRLYEQIDQAARSEAPALITGEVGVGKGVVAREVHERGERAAAPFASCSCASLTWAELFGCVSDDGGVQPGQFQDAAAGTLALEDVDELSDALQAALLRALQERIIRPEGGAPEPLRSRVLVTTRVDLAALTSAGGFREDLFYRLDVLRLNVPPLRDRPEDVAALLLEFTAGEGTPLQVTPEVMTRLLAYPWPGNVRELQNEATRLRARREGEVSLAALSPEVQAEHPDSDGSFAGKTLPDVERAMVADALAQAGGNKSQAARLLGVPRSTLYDLLRRHRL